MSADADSAEQSKQTGSPGATAGAPRSRLARYDHFFDTRTFTETMRKTQKQVTKEKKHNSKRPVLVVRRIIDSKGRLSGVVIDIKSPLLCEVLQELTQGFEGLSLTRNPATADPKLFFHLASPLKELYETEVAKSSTDSAALIADLEVALQYIEEDHGHEIVDFAQQTSHGEIVFDLLWALFPPNCLVYHYHDLSEQPQILLARTTKYQNTNEGTVFVVTCDIVTSDGKKFGLARSNGLGISEYSGTKKIESLSVYPLAYKSEWENVKQHAIARGKRFSQMAEQSFLETTGPAMAEGPRDGKWIKFNGHGRVMIDPKTFRTFQPNSTYNFPVHEAIARDVMTDDLYSICNPVAIGFSFNTKRWGGFAMDRLKDIAWNDEIFHSLVLGPKHKSLILSLVKQHKKRAAIFDDIVVGKGKGLIGLLSGNPGTGKTLTAEAIADITRRPLYIVSAGELGTAAVDVDDSLSRILELARIWDTVLLLDEAEVFLQARDSIDLQRNALVSIFLRQLEYYHGVLILTTNRIHDCDPAFESRIHFSIHYPDLNFESRKAIWKTFVRRAVEHQETKSEITEENLNLLAIREMNGRQIKNAVSNAQSIALENEAPFDICHITAVMEVTDDWVTAKRKLFGEQE